MWTALSFLVVLLVIAWRLGQIVELLRGLSVVLEVHAAPAPDGEGGGDDDEPDPGEDVLEQPPRRVLRVVGSKH